MCPPLIETRALFLLAAPHMCMGPTCDHVYIYTYFLLITKSTKRIFPHHSLSDSLSLYFPFSSIISLVHPLWQLGEANLPYFLPIDSMDMRLHYLSPQLPILYHITSASSFSGKTCSYLCRLSSPPWLDPSTFRQIQWPHLRDEKFFVVISS